jgi:hypothetical protein
MLCKCFFAFDLFQACEHRSRLVTMQKGSMHMAQQHAASGWPVLLHALCPTLL